MKFCPSCETRLKSKSEQNILLCPKCGFIVDNNKEKNNNSTNIKTPTLEENTSTNLKIMDEDKGPEALPITNLECEKCKNTTAYWWMLQTRSADEATTQFYRCTKCNHTWRNYS